MSYQVCLDKSSYYSARTALEPNLTDQIKPELCGRLDVFYFKTLVFSQSTKQVVLKALRHFSHYDDFVDLDRCNDERPQNDHILLD